MPNKGLFLKIAEKIVKKEAGRTKRAFWSFKRQNFEKVYKIKIKNHAIFYIYYNSFLTSSDHYV